MERKTSSQKKETVQSSVKRRIPFLCGRPRRETAIDHDDSLNLEIALHTCKTVDELLKQL
ncbi:MAG TPA: hypothetical protein VLX68_03795 [Chitinivibrionales bacterium]|nr:hypothetical protein [Chitinivibrionales bacterium]